VVRVTAARWQRCIISVSGTSTNPNAILTVWLNDSNSPMFQLTNLGGGANFVLADPQGFVCRADL
jgi:hypothetical protein